MRFLLPLLFSVLLASCCCKKKTTTGTEAGPPPPVVVSDVQIDKNYTPPAAPDYTVEGLSLSGDVLYVFVSYSGGCKTHTFEAVTTGALAKSMPPQMTLHLEHEKNGETCRELKNDTLPFNVKPLQQPSTKTIVLKMGDKSATYKY